MGFLLCTGCLGVNSEYVSSEGYSVAISKFSSVPPTLRSEGRFCSLLKTAARKFQPDSALGEGGFGSVFKGNWIDEHLFAATKPGTCVIITAKRLNQESLQGHRKWLAEVNFLGQLCHLDLVKLLGYCPEDEQRLLVYEFKP